MNPRQLIPSEVRQSLAATLTRILIDDADATPERHRLVDHVGWNVDIDLRNATKPAGWLVLTELLERSRAEAALVGAGGQGCIETNVRDLARTTGLSKDTVARALQRLIRLGLVDRLEVRDGSGRFGRSLYRIDRSRLGFTPA